LVGVACRGAATTDGPAAPATPPPSAAPAPAPSGGPDTIATSAGPLVITPLRHASLAFRFAGKTIYVDPWSEAKLDGLPKGDFVFVTDIHADHLDSAAIDKVKKPDAVLVGPPAVSAQRAMGVVLKNGESHDFGAFRVEAVPMYNLTRGPEAGKLFHDKGRGDGYVFTFGDKRVYVSGDTECTPEMRALTSIDVAFVCMNLPYTMPPAEAAECVRAFKPKVVYPFHYRGQDPAAFAAMLKDTPAIEVRLREWY
jgi:L-ascorbate metabolism protein UlaG (beta-lactamase superfamily)